MARIWTPQEIKNSCINIRSGNYECIADDEISIDEIVERFKEKLISGT